jgi:hypothetical protein
MRHGDHARDQRRQLPGFEIALADLHHIDPRIHGVRNLLQQTGLERRIVQGVRRQPSAIGDEVQDQGSARVSG